MEYKKYLIYLFFILLIGLMGFIALTYSETKQSTGYTYPKFQPGIWDKPVIKFPPNSTAGMQDYPFIFQYDLSASYGFDAQYVNHIRPTFVLSKGKHAVIAMNVTSQSMEMCTISFDKMIGFPEEGYVRYAVPSPVVLEPGSSKEMILEMYFPENATHTSGTGSTDMSGQEIPIGLFLTSGEWSVGQGFFLKIIS